MQIKDVLNESVTDVVARFYREASDKYDKFFNPEDVKYKEKNHRYYDEHFKDWFAEELVPVFTKPVHKPQPAFTPIPKEGKRQSPGYRGLHMALARSGNEYDHKVQRYEARPGDMIAPSTMVPGGMGAMNN